MMVILLKQLLMTYRFISNLVCCLWRLPSCMILFSFSLVFTNKGNYHKILKPMSFILILDPVIQLSLTNVTDEFTGLQNINNFIMGRNFAERSMPFRKTPHHQERLDLLEGSISVTVVALLVVATLLQGLLSCSLPFNFNWLKRHLLPFTYSNSVLGIVAIFSEIFFSPEIHTTFALSHSFRLLAETFF